MAMLHTSFCGVIQTTPTLPTKRTTHNQTMPFLKKAFQWLSGTTCIACGVSNPTQQETHSAQFSRLVEEFLSPYSTIMEIPVDRCGRSQILCQLAQNRPDSLCTKADPDFWTGVCAGETTIW